MKQTIAAKKLVAELVRIRVLIHDDDRARAANEHACRSLQRWRKPAGVVPGGEIVAVLNVSRAYRRAAGSQ
jgi:hypothetical protein